MGVIRLLDDLDFISSSTFMHLEVVIGASYDYNVQCVTLSVLDITGFAAIIIS